ncbi:MAG: class I SAM-dependent methyltransferase [Candidatus Levyibacteriota bacterium]
MKVARKKKVLSDPELIELHGEIIRRKKLLNLVYRRFYEEFKVPIMGQKRIVELGSGGGFLKEIIPGVTTSDVISGPYVDHVFSAEKMPFKDNSIDAFLMLNTFHHIKDPGKALAEMNRCLRRKGKIIMVEPYATWFSGIIYRHFHYEGFDKKATWQVQGKNRMESNNALPWIIFTRDRALFREKFPSLKIHSIRLHTPVQFLLSGGLSHPQFIPNFSIPFFAALEKAISPFNKFFALYSTIEIIKAV